MNPKTSAVMSTKMGENPILCDTKSSSGNMDCNWNGAIRDPISARSKPMSDTLSKLARLITCMEYKPKPHKSSSVCKESSESNAPVSPDERERALQKLHRCHPCGQKFALRSSLQKHMCPRLSTACQTSWENPSRTSSCSSFGTDTSAPRQTEAPFYRDSGPYACAPCGQAFVHKQELLIHQQAGICQPDTPKPPSHSCTSRSTCSLCSRTFRSSAGLACHVRLSHPQLKSAKKSVIVVSAMRKRKKKVLLSSMLFPCRSCDKSFPKTSLLHRHRKEEHRRDIKLRIPVKQPGKVTRQRQKGETYPCLHCGKEFLHHLTRWAHFKHYSSHHQTHLRLNDKTSSDEKFIPKTTTSELTASHQPRPRGRPRKYPLPVPKPQEETDEDTDEDSQYPCTSCERVFSSKASLYAHEKVHKVLPEEEPEIEDERRCCSVCEGGIQLEIPEDCEARVYHCVPCAEAFVALDAFLEHCKKHLVRDREDEFSDD